MLATVLPHKLRANPWHAVVCGEEDPELPILRFPKLVDHVLSYYLRALDYGGPANKLQAIDGIEQGRRGRCCSTR